MNRGYTLIEMLVVLTVLILFLGIGVANFQAETEQNRIDQGQRKIGEILNLARKNAIAGQVSTNCIGTLLGYKVTLMQNPQRLAVYMMCNGTDVLYYTYRIDDIQNVSLSMMDYYSVLTSSSQGNISSMIFKTVQGGAQYQFGSGYADVDSNDRIRFIMQDAATNQCGQIRINASGFISECKVDSCGNTDNCTIVVQ